MQQEVIRIFTEKHQQQPSVFRSPGRVNIIGEHTDYNDGFVLPGAIDKYIYVAVGKREDSSIKLYAVDFKEECTEDINNVKKSEIQWANYILGVVDQLQKNGCILTGFNLVIDGDVPLGSGLSSSAAVECATAFALNTIFNLGLEKVQMAHFSQLAEHTFPGVNCGIMDQFASMLGKKDHLIKLDCRSLEYEYIPFDIKGYKIVLLNTNVKHSLSSSQYNVRRQQCEEAVSIIKEFYPHVKNLRDVTMEMLDEHVADNPLIYKRARYVVGENIRLLAACEDLQQGNIEALGIKMLETHYALSTEYEVSCKELDFLVDFVKDNPAVAGARMMGGGFGGCTINLIKEEEIEKLIAAAGIAYEQAMNLPLTSYLAVIEDGTAEITNTVV